MDLKKINNIYFIGIGGMGMSALARYFNDRQVRVSGYDKFPSALSRKLEEEGIPIHYEENADLLDLDANLIVYTPAIPPTNKELEFYRNHGYEVVKRSEVLEIITRNYFNISVAGTHGKTTISTMIAHLLRHSGLGGNAFLGGISVNYDTNFWSSSNPVAVVEADEYDRSFLRLNPDLAVVSAMDPDHLDIYGTQQAMEEAFIEFTARIKPKGTLVSKLGLQRSADLKGDQHFRYHLNNHQADLFAEKVEIIEGGYQFNLSGKLGTIENIRLHIGGLHNVENAIAACSVGWMMGVQPQEIKSALEDYKGVKRRFEFVIRNAETIYIDDYAHHPEELKVLINGAKTLFPGKKCTLIFQPHLFSRTRDLAEDFAKSLDLADEIILLPIYPARELPIPGISSSLIAGMMKNKSVQLLTMEQSMKWLSENKISLLITAGAGDIDQMAGAILQQWTPFSKI
ncbi:MAG: UDP-N-acetylmuramate--L-alanine ligase [Chitinophagaceae bacterium]